MKKWTLLEIKTKINKDLDLEVEDFVTDSELTGYINDAIDDAESEIHLLGRDKQYFKKWAWINLISGQAEYALPEDIYDDKIYELVVMDGTSIYPLQRIKEEFPMTKIELANLTPQPFPDGFTLVDSSLGDRVLMFTPKPSASKSQAIKMWYARNANRLVDDDDVCDIPEFVTYVIAFAKYEVLKKEGNANAAEELANRDRLRQNMVAVLGQNLDEQDKIVQDLSHYDEAT